MHKTDKFVSEVCGCHIRASNGASKQIEMQISLCRDAVGASPLPDVRAQLWFDICDAGLHLLSDGWIALWNRTLDHAAHLGRSFPQTVCRH